MGTVPVSPPSPPYRCPVIQSRRQGQGHGWRAGVELAPRLGRWQGGDVDAGGPERRGVGAIGLRAVGVVGPGSADPGQLIE